MCFVFNNLRFITQYGYDVNVNFGAIWSERLVPACWKTSHDKKCRQVEYGS